MKKNTSYIVLCLACTLALLGFSRKNTIAQEPSKNKAEQNPTNSTAGASKGTNAPEQKSKTEKKSGGDVHGEASPSGKGTSSTRGKITDDKASSSGTPGVNDSRSGNNPAIPGGGQQGKPGSMPPGGGSATTR